MRNYNLLRPLWLIAIALLTRLLVTSVCLLLGTSSETASNIGFIAMIIAAILTFRALNKRRRKHK